MYTSRNNGNNIYFLSLTKSVLFSYIITLFFMVVFAIILTYTNVSENIIPVVDSIIMILSIALGAIYMATKTEKLGWLNGALIGLIYIIILIVIRKIILNSLDINAYLIIKVLISFITGAVGGMIGVNIK